MVTTTDCSCVNDPSLPDARVRVDDGLVTGLYAVRNPEKLSRMEQATSLRR